MLQDMPLKVGMQLRGSWSWKKKPSNSAKSALSDMLSKDEVKIIADPANIFESITADDDDDDDDDEGFSIAAATEDGLDLTHL